MADIEIRIYIEQSDNTAFSEANEAGAAVRLRSSVEAGTDSGEYTGNVAGSGAFTDRGNGKWSINVDSEDSGYFRIESYTTATGTWAAVSGYAPLLIQLEPNLALDGGTMSGNIAMGENEISGIRNLVFNAPETGQINGTVANNLVDKSAAETIAGAWDFDGACTVTAGSFDFTEDKLLIDSIIAQPYIYITYSEASASYIKAANVNKTLFICDAAYEVVSIEGFTETAETTAATLYIQVERLSGVEAIGGGDDILTNNTNNGFDLKGTAKSPRSGTLTNTTLADGDRIGLVLSADGTEAAGLSITIKLKRI